MNTLQTIIDHKKKEVQEKKDLYPVKLLERTIYYNSPCVSLKPDTTEERIHKIDTLSDAFIYLVATSGTTGAKENVSDAQQDYFKRIASYQLKNPLLAGFGISNKETFEKACTHTNGAIIGSAFIKALEKDTNTEKAIKNFVSSIKQLEHIHK
jgi:tryptophan synthase alpha chain